jgi:hypothetical protein
MNLINWIDEEAIRIFYKHDKLYALEKSILASHLMIFLIMTAYQTSRSMTPKEKAID